MIWNYIKGGGKEKEVMNKEDNYTEQKKDNINWRNELREIKKRLCVVANKKQLQGEDLTGLNKIIDTIFKISQILGDIK